jgi:hypothetical protein
MSDPIERLKGSFPLFVWYVWTKVLALAAPTAIQLAIASWLAGGPRRRVVHAYRGVGKTFLTAAYIVWRLWRNPDLKILVISASETYASEISRFILQIILADDLWAELRPRVDGRNSVLAFDVGNARLDKSPSVKAAGVFGQVTGSRADIILFDDVEVPKTSETQAMREKLAQRVTEAAALLKNEHGEIIYLGTPQDIQSLYLLLPERGYAVRYWPARVPNPATRVRLGDMLAPDIAAMAYEADPLTDLGGQPTDPVRFSSANLLERELEMGRSNFLLQYQLDTSLSDADKYPLRLRDLIVMDVDQEQAPLRVMWSSEKQYTHEDLPNPGLNGDRFIGPMMKSETYAPYTGRIMVVDPSGRGKDETGYAVGLALQGAIHVPAWGGLPSGYDEPALVKLAEIAKANKVNKVIVESNFGDGMFTALLKPILNRIYPVPVEEVRSVGQKELRIIDTLEPVLNTHRLIIDKKVIERDLRIAEPAYRGTYQLAHLTRLRGALQHDDRIEALAMLAAAFQKALARDQERVEADHKDKLLEKELREFELRHGLIRRENRKGVGVKQAKGRLRAF